MINECFINGVDHQGDESTSLLKISLCTLKRYYGQV